MPLLMWPGLLRAQLEAQELARCRPAQADEDASAPDESTGTETGDSESNDSDTNESETSGSVSQDELGELQPPPKVRRSSLVCGRGGRHNASSPCIADARCLDRE